MRLLPFLYVTKCKQERAPTFIIEDPLKVNHALFGRYLLRHLFQSHFWFCVLSMFIKKKVSIGSSRTATDEKFYLHWSNHFGSMRWLQVLTNSLLFYGQDETFKDSDLYLLENFVEWYCCSISLLLFIFHESFWESTEKLSRGNQLQFWLGVSWVRFAPATCKNKYSIIKRRGGMFISVQSSRWLYYWYTTHFFFFLHRLMLYAVKMSIE